MTEQLKARTKSTYNAASDHFDAEPLGFWERFGRATIERAGVGPGMRILDVCCGTGASGLEAADRVRPSGTVVGVDIAERLLERARAKASARGLRNAEFVSGDMERLPFAAGTFDAVVCVFGIFFVPEISNAVRELWRTVKRGGKLAVTTWGPGVFEPANTAFWRAVGDVRPELVSGLSPWERIQTPDGLRSVLGEGGVAHAEIVPEAATHPLRTPEDWWTIVLGTGYRGTVDQLTDEEAARVRASTLESLRAGDVRALGTNVIYAISIKD